MGSDHGKSKFYGLGVRVDRFKLQEEAPEEFSMLRIQAS
jgi:hypothetical protein